MYPGQRVQYGDCCCIRRSGGGRQCVIEGLGLSVVRLFRLLCVVLLCLTPIGAGAFWQSRSQSSITTASGSCTASTAFLARTSGLNAAHINAYDTMICGLVTDGVFSSLDALYVFATNSTTNANLNLVSASFPVTQNGTVTFTVDQGYSGSAGSANNLDTAFVPTTGSPHFVQDSAHIGVWRISASNFASDALRQGGHVVVNSIFPRFTDGNMYCDINASSDDGVGVAVPTTGAGFASCSRTASTGYVYYKNGSSLGTRTNASTAVLTGSFEYLAAAGGGDVAVGSFGAGLTSTQMANLYARIHVYLQTIAGVP